MLADIFLSDEMELNQIQWVTRNTRWGWRHDDAKEKKLIDILEDEKEELYTRQRAFEHLLHRNQQLYCTVKPLIASRREALHALENNFYDTGLIIADKELILDSLNCYPRHMGFWRAIKRCRDYIPVKITVTDRVVYQTVFNTPHDCLEFLSRMDSYTIDDTKFNPYITHYFRLGYKKPKAIKDLILRVVKLQQHTYYVVMGALRPDNIKELQLLHDKLTA